MMSQGSTKVAFSYDGGAASILRTSRAFSDMENRLVAYVSLLDFIVTYINEGDSVHVPSEARNRAGRIR